MKTHVDACLIEIAQWFIDNRRELLEVELLAILRRHCENEEEMTKFAKFLETEAGQMRFRTHLRELLRELR